jgi:hypothetical protein
MLQIGLHDYAQKVEVCLSGIYSEVRPVCQGFIRDTPYPSGFYSGDLPTSGLSSGAPSISDLLWSSIRQGIILSLPPSVRVLF